MELNLCPSCDGYVRPEWTECASCSAPLAPGVAPEAPLPPKPTAEPSAQRFTPTVTQPSAAPRATRRAGAHFKEGALDSLEEWVDNELTPAPVTPTIASFGAASVAPQAPPSSQSQSHIRIPHQPPPPIPQRPTWTPSETAPKVPKSSIDTTKVLIVAGGLGLVLLVGAAILSLVIIFAVAPDKVAATDTPVVATEGNKYEWTTFKDPAGTFTVELPAKAETKEEGGAFSVSSVYGDGPDGEVEVSRIPVNASTGDDQLFNDIMRSAKAQGLEVRTNFIITENGQKKFTAQFYEPTEKSYGDIEAFRVGDNLFLVAVFTNNPAGDPQVFSRVTNSLKPTVR